MKRFKLIVAYDGTNYCGWQVQPNEKTIEGELNRVLTQLTGEKIEVIGASRTDAGVHAYGNVAVFDADTPIPGEKLMFAVNAHLPADIRVVDSCEIDPHFHPRHCDTKKTYEYHIQTGHTPFPTRRLYCHWIPRRLDTEEMKQAGQYLVGTHDFKSFCSSKTQVKTTVRTVTRIDVREIPTDCPGQNEVIIEVEGEGFLYNMVRIISGTLIKVGLHGLPPEKIIDILEARDRCAAGETVPAQGLFLKKIEYLEKNELT